jgi:predicted ATP-grasp superfamily ATP-dependent carboligase
MTSDRVGVVGASARAAVMSLARAGFAAWAVDLFADRDLQRIAPCIRCPLADFPQAIPELAERFPSGPVMYTGGLENYPDIVQELACRRPLWGNGPEVLRRVRDPFELAKLLPTTPPALPAGSPAPAQGRWLVKSLRSSGGLGVRFAKVGEVCPSGSYLQNYIPGPPMSAVFRDRELLGITEQLVGTPWLHAKPFHYCGTIGTPIAKRLSGDIGHLTGLRQIGNDASLGLRGAFGIDFILNEGLAYVVEVNPRYPASLEAIEYASRTGSVVGKAIYFAPRGFRFPSSGPWEAELRTPFDPWRLPRFADIPEPGEPMEAGSPVLTFFVSGSSAEECRDRLQSRAVELDRFFSSPS